MVMPIGTVSLSVFMRDKYIYVILFHCLFFLKVSDYQVNTADVLEYETT